MSTLRVTNLKGGSAGSAPNLPDGANVTGVITATSFSGSGANLTGIDATALKDGGGSVKVQANSDGAVVTGVLTATTGSFTGNVSVGGTLTYEDVTNVDSVGVITARSGIVATGVVTATSFSGSGANLTGIEAAPTIQATVSGTIAAEKSVYVKSDGTVSQVSENPAGFASNEYTFESGSLGTSIQINQKSMAYDVTNKVMLCVYRDVSNNNYLTAVAGTVTSGGAITWGTPVKSPNDNDGVTEVSVCWDSYSERFVAAYRDSGSSRGRLQVITVSGTTVSFPGNVNNINGNNDMSWISIAAFPPAQRCMVVYRDHSDSYKVKSRVIVDHNATPPNPGTYNAVEVDGQNCVGMKLIHDPDANRAVLVYASTAENYKGYVRIGTCGSSSVSWGNRQEFTNYHVKTGDADAQGGLDVAYSPGLDRALVVFAHADGDNDHIIGGRAFSISTSNTVTFSSNQQWLLDTSDYDGIRLSANTVSGFDSTLLLTYSDWEDYKRGKGNILTLSNNGATITVGSQETFNSSYTGSNSTQNLASLFHPDSNVYVVSFTDNGDSNKGKAVARIRSSTNMTTGNFIGFSKEAYTNGQTATIKVVGNVSTQSGLTPGQKYYVQQDGTLATTPADPNVEGGKALTATSLLIAG